MVESSFHGWLNDGSESVIVVSAKQEERKRKSEKMARGFILDRR